MMTVTAPRREISPREFTDLVSLSIYLAGPVIWIYILHGFQNVKSLISTCQEIKLLGINHGVTNRERPDSHFHLPNPIYFLHRPINF